MILRVLPCWFLLLSRATFCLVMLSGAGLAPGQGTDQETTATSPRERLLLDSGWHFHLGDAADAGNKFDYPEVAHLDKTSTVEIGKEGQLPGDQNDAEAVNLGADVSFVQPGFDDSNWTVLNLPHDWAVSLPYQQSPDHDNIMHGSKPVGPTYPANDIGWYRRKFELPAGDKDKALWLEFDGVYRNSVAWLNGHCLGRAVSGYTSFYRDISKYANFGGANTLVVRVDATRYEGWFYEGAGIYRHVWLLRTSPVHVVPNGIFVYSKFPNNVPDGPAEVHAQVQMANASSLPASPVVDFQILDPEGKPADRAEMRGAFEGSGQAEIHAVLSVPSPELWSPDTPRLYTLVATVKSGGAIVDEVRTPFGIRTVAFDPNRGFLLNGKPCFIKGTCVHQDYAGLGIAVPDQVQVFRVARLKEMGSNGVRTAHNDPAPEFLDACDRQGMLVMDENRRMDSSPMTLADLKTMILRDRNHPSVFIWSLGNEEDITQRTPAGRKIAAAMVDVAHQTDPTRLTTAAMDFGWRDPGFAEVLDVIGCNYARGDSPDQAHWSYPARPMIGSETGSVLGTRGVYFDANVDGKVYHNDYGTSGTHSNFYLTGDKKNLTAEEWWKYYIARPYLSGIFIWTGFDYRGEPSPQTWPNIAAPFGAVDLCGFPKGAFYYYQSVWTDKPMLHLLPHWNAPKRTDKPLKVIAYTNCDEVELFLNGQSQGRQKVDPYSHAEWQVLYAPGTLSAKGYKAGQEAASDTVETTGPAVAIRLIPDRTSLRGDGEDVSMVTVEALDDHGRIVPDAQNPIHFQIQGGTILAVGNGDTASSEPDQGDQRSLFNGLAQVIVQAPRSAATITLTADSPGLQSATATLEADGSGPRPFVPQP